MSTETTVRFFTLCSLRLCCGRFPHMPWPNQSAPSRCCYSNFLARKKKPTNATTPQLPGTLVKHTAMFSTGYIILHTYKHLRSYTYGHSCTPHFIPGKCSLPWYVLRICIVECSPSRRRLRRSGDNGSRGIIQPLPSHCLAVLA